MCLGWAASPREEQGHSVTLLHPLLWPLIMKAREIHFFDLSWKYTLAGLMSLYAASLVQYGGFCQH